MFAYGGADGTDAFIKISPGINIPAPFSIDSTVAICVYAYAASANRGDFRQIVLHTSFSSKCPLSVMLRIISDCSDKCFMKTEIEGNRSRGWVQGDTRILPAPFVIN